jgi:hypothetical protein
MTAVIPGAEQFAGRQADAQRDLGRHRIGVGAPANAVGAEIFPVAHGLVLRLAASEQETFRNPFLGAVRPKIA